MRRRIAIWASLGFLIASSWILFIFVAGPENLNMAMREPAVEAVAFASCPIAFAGRHFPLPFWCVPLINAATYSMIGLIAEALRRKSVPGLAI
jgi:hypothetical protein